jgi:peptidoglycan/xylan/chitin deacetylase (PgdA/CDA1 family)
MLPWRAVFSRLSPAGAKARLAVLIFHRVLPQPDPLFPGEVDAARFDTLCGWLKRWFNVLPLNEAARRMAQGRLPSRAAAITFDDGYADNCTVAMPILQRHGLCATFFVATGFIDGGRMWNDTVIESVRHAPGPQLDLVGTAFAELGVLPLATVEDRREAIQRLIMAAKYRPPLERQHSVDSLTRLADRPLADDLMMTSDQVRALAGASMQVGAHTVNHPILTGLPRERILDEVRDSRAWLEEILRSPVGLFAYPNGKPGLDYGPEAVEVVRELGFEAAVSTVPAMARAGGDRWQIPRYTPWDRTPNRFALRLARQYAAPG